MTREGNTQPSATVDQVPTVAELLETSRRILAEHFAYPSTAREWAIYRDGCAAGFANGEAQGRLAALDVNAHERHLAELRDWRDNPHQVES